MAIIKQVVKGSTVKTLDVDASNADLTELIAILAGEVQTFELKSEGGSTATTPSALNRKRYSCGDKSSNISCSFTVPHAKLTANTPEFEAVVIGAFDASYDSSTKCDYMNLFYDRN